jgi:hypothetical protein
MSLLILPRVHFIAASCDQNNSCNACPVTGTYLQYERRVGKLQPGPNNHGEPIISTVSESSAAILVHALNFLGA